jgi:hypothetical protein
VHAKKNQTDENVNAMKIQNSTEMDTNIIRADSVTTYPTSVFTIGPIPNEIIAPTNIQFSNPFVQSLSSSLLENTVEVNTSELNVTFVTEEKAPSKSTELVLEMDNISIASSSSFDTVKEFSSEQCESNAALAPEVMATLKMQIESNESIGMTDVNDCLSMDVLDERAARLRNLEEQAEWLVRRVNDTNRRSSDLSTRLEVLHETYGSVPEAPPMPDILSTFRLQTEVSESENSEARVNINDSEEKSRDDQSLV